jgi:hypothetical protein
MLNPMPLFEIAAAPHRFGSARDAIDAVSAFEASSLHDWEYALQCVTDDPGHIYVVRLNCLTGTRVRGYLRPVAS